MLISIDKFIFKAEHNITNLKKTITVNYDKQNTITKPIYSHLGGYDESISFEAKILLKHHEDFKKFEALVKQAKPLKISAFDLVEAKHILINQLSITATL